MAQNIPVMGEMSSSSRKPVMLVDQGGAEAGHSHQAGMTSRVVTSPRIGRYADTGPSSLSATLGPGKEAGPESETSDSRPGLAALW
jgi:hypothetical protein